MINLKKILIVGSNSFVGFNSILELGENQENQIVGIDDEKDEIKNRFLRNLLGERFEFLKLDIRESWQLKSLFRFFKPDIILNLPSSSLSNEKIIKGTWNLLRTLATLKNGDDTKLIFLSSKKVYGLNVNKIPTIENEKRFEYSRFLQNGVPEKFEIGNTIHTLNGLSILMAELLIQEFAFNNEIGPVTIFRASNICGLDSNDWLSKMVATAVKDKLIRCPLNKKKTSDVLHVKDLINAFQLSLEHSSEYKLYNIGGGIDNTLSIIEALELIEDKLGKEVKTFFDSFDPEKQIRVFYPDIRKIQKELNWHSKMCPTEIIDDLIHANYQKIKEVENFGFIPN